jgi:hypothetical protein
MGLDIASTTLTFGDKLIVVLISAIVHHAVYIGSGTFSKKLFAKFGFSYADQRSWRSRYVHCFDFHYPYYAIPFSLETKDADGMPNN